MSDTAPAITHPDVDLMFLLSWSNHALSSEMAANLADLGISPRAHCVLYKARHGELTQTQIAESIGLDKTTMVVLTDRLEKDGLAERTPSPSDRRVKILTLTDKGRRLVRRSQEIVDRTHRDVLDSLPAELRAPFVEALTLLVGGRLSTFTTSEQPPRRRSARL
ncbi:MarR family winged helix-turn-helix transcriptional regulator [Streptomyces carpaticus]|uniref:MarR family winged helix-turn-helix transcriptional regulator n=1 Tax=Streptomyces carpaticus TaxID=285558 RepID=A0ABV4ZTT8_9ACTN